MSKVITPKAQFSYANAVVAVAGRDDNGNPTPPIYSTGLVFTKDDDLSDIRKTIAGVVVAKFGPEKAKEILGKMVPGGSIKNPLRADIDKKYGDGSNFFMNARNANKPQIVHPFAGADGRPQMMTDAEAKELVYSGAYGRASVSFFWFDKKGNKGVGCGLNNIQWLGHGERLDGRVAAANEFDVVVESAASAADLSAFLNG